MCLSSTPKAIPTARNFLSTPRVANHISTVRFMTKTSNEILFFYYRHHSSYLWRHRSSVRIQSARILLRVPQHDCMRRRLLIPAISELVLYCITQERTRNQLIRTWRLSRVCASPSRPPPTSQLCSSSPSVLFS